MAYEAEYEYISYQIYIEGYPEALEAYRQHFSQLRAVSSTVGKLLYPLNPYNSDIYNQYCKTVGLPNYPTLKSATIESQKTASFLELYKQDKALKEKLAGVKVEDEVDLKSLLAEVNQNQERLKNILQDQLRELSAKKNGLINAKTKHLQLVAGDYPSLYSAGLSTLGYLVAASLLVSSVATILLTITATALTASLVIGLELVAIYAALTTAVALAPFVGLALGGVAGALVAAGISIAGISVLLKAVEGVPEFFKNKLVEPYFVWHVKTIKEFFNASNEMDTVLALEAQQPDWEANFEKVTNEYDQAISQLEEALGRSQLVADDDAEVNLDASASMSNS